MPQFSYKARRRTGEVVEGMLEVADRSAALIQIERLGLFPVVVDSAKGGIVIAAQRSSGQKADWRAILPPTPGPRQNADWRRHTRREGRRPSHEEIPDSLAASVA